jgi:hypothetical protein
MARDEQSIINETLNQFLPKTQPKPLHFFEPCDLIPLFALPGCPPQLGRANFFPISLQEERSISQSDFAVERDSDLKIKGRVPPN